jgi:hypothetical protein
MQFRAFLATATGIALLGTCARADAANITVGNPLLPVGGKVVYGCQNPEGCTFVSIALPESSGLAQSPVNGVIVKWGMRNASVAPAYAIRVLQRQKSALEFTGAGTSTPVSSAGFSLVQTFEADLPIHAGDYIGLNVPEEGGIGVNETPGAQHGFFSPTLEDGFTHTTGDFANELAFYAEVQPAPAITQVAPATGPSSGGTVVKVTGSDFRGVIGVKFGTVPATSFSVESDGSLEATAPPVSSPQFVDVSVRTNAGTSEPTFHDFFEYIPSPTAPSPSPVCLVPEVLGKKLAAARKHARRADCAIGHVRKLRMTTVRTGRVVMQNPKAGRTVPEGTRIAVTLR